MKRRKRKYDCTSPVLAPRPMSAEEVADLVARTRAADERSLQHPGYDALVAHRRRSASDANDPERAEPEGLGDEN